jgi:GT2 family glycosyltransferase
LGYNGDLAPGVIQVAWRKEVKASIIVIGFNGKRFLADCLYSLFDQDMPREDYEVLYVDNNSTDGSVEYVEKEFPSVIVIKFIENRGFYNAFNEVAVNIAQGMYLVALPQDTILHRQWLSELVRVAESEKDVMVCLANTVQITSPDHDIKEREKEIKWKHLMRTTKLGFVVPERQPFSKEPVLMLAASGTSGLLKRDLLTVTDYFFDPLLGHFIGDVELGLRVNVLGYKVALVPTSILYHIEEGKNWLDKRLLLRSLEGARDNILAYYKNMYSLEFILFLPFLLIGTPLKAYALRTTLWRRTLFFIAALPLSPFAFLLAVLSFSRIAQERREVVSKRNTGQFWLLRIIITSGRQ